MRPYIFAEAEKIGIELIDLSPDDPELPIMATVISNAQSGDRSILRNIGRQPQLDLEILRKELIEEPEIALLDGFHMDAARPVAAYVARQSKAVVMDGGSWKDRSPELISLSNVAICSADFKSPEMSVMNYLLIHGIHYRAITNGHKAVQFEEGKIKGEIQVPKVNAVDSLGAGDVFHGAFCYFYGQKHSFQDSLRKAAEIASESTTYFGTRPNR